jgi:predicted nucleic acid-binding protein
MEFISRYVPQTIGFKHAKKCAELQRRARKAGKRFGENDAWQLAFAECSGATIVARDRKAFGHLGRRYDQFDSPKDQVRS